MKFHKHTKGYSLVEVMVAVTILMLSIIGPITIAAKSYQSAQYSKQQTTAFFLAQEGITAMNTIRNNGGVDMGSDPWAWTTDPDLDPCFDEGGVGCNIDFSDSSLLDNIEDCSTEDCRLNFDPEAGRSVYHLGSSGEESPYTRIITLRFAGSDEVIVESTVVWDSHLLGSVKEVRLTTSLFNLYK